MTVAKMIDWTYGAEHEVGDWDRNMTLPEGMKVDERDVTVMNDNGIAADPRGRLYDRGGEINTIPSSCAIGQIEQLRWIRKWGGTINHRSNLHLHIRVPGLRDNLPALKRIAEFGQRVLPVVLPLIEPLPRPARGRASSWRESEDEWKGVLRRWKRRRVSHQTILPDRLHQRRMQATTPQEFFDWGVVANSQGKPMHHLQPREAVNLRQLMQTDTIEFRHFPGTLSEYLLAVAIEYCKCYLQCALDGDADFITRSARITGQIIPWPEYVHWKEVRYRATCHDGTLTLLQIQENIRAILKGEFDDH